MNITKHTVERYVERYINLNSTESTKSYLATNENKVREWIMKEFESAELFYTGQIKNKSTVNYYLLKASNRIYITDTNDSSIITTYPIEFGFSAEIDKQIATMVIKELNDTKHAITAKREENQTTLEDLYTDKERKEDQVKDLEVQLQKAKNDLNLAKELIDSVTSDNTELNRKEKASAEKLINSKYYTKEVADRVL